MIRDPMNTIRPLMMHHFQASIKLSKSDAEASRAATNATIVVTTVTVQLNGPDLCSIRIPGANLTTGRFYSAQLQDADLTGVGFSR
ncbi:hypothetical protein BGX21_011443, partial [Mortierella sp. AD011]